MHPVQDKAELRRRMLDRRRGEPPPDGDRIGRDLRLRFGEWPWPSWVRTVAGFLSLPAEVPTEGLLADRHAAGCRLCVPAWDVWRRGYRLAAFRPGDSCVAGPLQIREPAVKAWVSPVAVDLFLVPGLAFDRSGGRLGYGGGHYDRLLAERAARSLLVGLALDWQVVDAVPMESHDRRMDWIATPRRMIRCRP